MSLQWVAVAGFLYVEIGLTLLLILPLLKPSIWKKIFSLSVFSTIQPVWSTVYYSILLVLVVLFMDSIRTMVKYGNELPEQTSTTLDAKLDRRLNECRGQRNFYITGFALFLILVIRRLISLLSRLAKVEADHAAMLSQAQNASAELQRRIDSEGTEPRDGGKDKSEEKKAPGPSKEEFLDMQNELKKAKADLETMKKQAESTSTEYDRLAVEHQKLLKQTENSDEGKKDQ